MTSEEHAEDDVVEDLEVDKESVDTIHGGDAKPAHRRLDTGFDELTGALQPLRNLAP